MGTAGVTVYAYSGTLASLNLGGLANTNVLNNISGPISGTITDDDGSLDSGDSGQSSGVFGATSGTIQYYGAGTVSMVTALGVKIDPHPVTVFTIGSQVYLMLPTGAPLLSGVSVSFSVNVNTATTLTNFVPCFAAGTMILTPRGERRVEDLVPGDLVTDIEGRAREVTWTGRRRVVFDAFAAPLAQELHPVVIPAHAFGRDMPARELRLSPQHRVLVDWPEVELLYGQERMLAPVGALAGDRIWVDRGCDEVTYCHFMCDGHAVVIANGLPAESLLPGPRLRSGMAPAAWAEICAVFPELQTEDMPSVLPLLSRREAQLLAMECRLC
ncbi:Hint domain-containing protein [Frigidibacter sp. MR17.14]|uniref:Hint domain-containing protein n=1 Tax=Frigidibacter sp. MR17.14 TaxID=3126509 RepID=UPI003012BA50